MSRSRWAISLLILWHVLALASSALPSPDLPEVRPRETAVTDPIAAPLTPFLDAVARALRPFPLAVRRAATPVVWAASTYVGGIGLAQNWRMFSNPPVVGEYVRLRYYVARGPDSGSRRPDWLATELVTSAHREDRPRLLKSYLEATSDKAVMIAWEQFSRHLRQRHAAASPAGPLPDDLAPVTRYFSRRFAAGHLLPDERIVRTEFWYGTAPITPRGAAGEAERRRDRLPILARYYEGPIEYRGPIDEYPAYRTAVMEADVRWVLEYFEDR